MACPRTPGGTHQGPPPSKGWGAPRMKPLPPPGTVTPSAPRPTLPQRCSLRGSGRRRGEKSSPSHPGFCIKGSIFWNKKTSFPQSPGKPGFRQNQFHRRANCTFAQPLTEKGPVRGGSHAGLNAPRAPSGQPSGLDRGSPQFSFAPGPHKLCLRPWFQGKRRSRPHGLPGRTAELPGGPAQET